MSAIPSDPPGDDDVDSGWDRDGDAPPESSARPSGEASGPSSSPTRGGTATWGEQLDDAVDAHRARLRQGSVAHPSPVRGNTRNWEELLPPPVLARYRAVAEAARRRASAVRGSTQRWKDLAGFVREEVEAAKRQAAEQGVADPLEELPVEDILAMIQLEESEAAPASAERPTSARDAGSEEQEAQHDSAPTIDVHGEELWDGSVDDKE